MVPVGPGQVVENTDFGNGLTLSIDDVMVDPEKDSGTTDVTFTVTLSAASGVATTFDVTTADDTAVADDDYLATSDSLTIAAGDGDSGILTREWARHPNDRTGVLDKAKT